MSFILKFVRWKRRIEIRCNALDVESYNPLVIFLSFLVKFVYSLERNNSNYIREL